MILLLITILLFAGYSVLIIYYWQSWRSIPAYVAPVTDPSIKFSVIIPARNEEENIGALLAALNNQSYAKELVEVIVIDDHSTDATAAIVKEFTNVLLITLPDDGINSYKKKAIEKGIAAASGKWIITTDADCIPGKDWLQTIAAYITEKKSVFVAAPVAFSSSSSILSIFQSLDFLVLQGITGASVHKNIHSMCNGANMAYEREAFYKVNGFTGIDNIASGDDMLLMHKIWRQYPQQVHYIKSAAAIVTTKPMQTWKDFFQQRIRWSSKAKSYDDKRIIAVLLLVYLFNSLFIVLIVAGCFNYYYWLLALAVWVGKTLVEFPFVQTVAGFFNKRALMKFFFFFQPLHIFYTVVSGFFGQFGKYEWKGRKVK